MRTYNGKMFMGGLPKDPARITLVRHGEDDPKRVGGWSDNDLTENGVAQVKALAESLTDKYDSIISSDLPRAEQTAKIIADKTGLNIEYDVGFRETNNGDYKNMTSAEFAARGCKRYADMRMDEHYPNGESPSEFFERVKSAFIRILEKYAGKNILIVTHGGVITVIECLVNGIEYTNKVKFAPPHATAREIRIG